MNLGCVSWLEIIYSLFIIIVCMKIIWHNRMVSFSPDNYFLVYFNDFGFVYDRDRK